MSDTSKSFGKAVKVAKVISPQQLVLNVGEKDGVKIGDKFLIVEIGEEVHDPDNGKSLGNFELVKGKASVFHITEKLCIVSPVKYRTGGLLSFQSYLAEGNDSLRSDPFDNPNVGDEARYIVDN